MNDDESIDLRRAFGQFATGVTIVTTSGPDEEPIGVTANSFSSVSLEPPMVLWSLSNTARSRQVFEDAKFFCVHILTASQRDVSELFSRRGAKKFAGIDWTHGPELVPVLDEYAARFHCRRTAQYSVGDHIVFAGEVLRYDRTDKRPLVFHGGQYAQAERRMMEDVARQVDDQPKFSRDRRKK